MSKACASVKSVFELWSVVLFAMVANCGYRSLGGGTSPDSGATAGSGGTAGGTGVATSTGGGAGGALTNTSGTGGSTTDTCNQPVTLLCTGTKPSSALISDFSLVNGATVPTAFGPWGQSLSGGAYVYPSDGSANPCDSASPYPITQSFTSGAWNVTGTVGTYSGMGIWWVCATGGGSFASSCLIDASAYTGISFKISGDAGPKGTIMVNVGTPSTVGIAVDSAGNPKSCAKCTAGPSCMKTASVPVTPTPTTVSFTWAELDVTEPDAIEQILLMLPDPCSYTTGTCVATPYSANVTVDDMTFTN